MNIKNLPVELQNPIFYYYAEHPLATMFKKEVSVVIYDYDSRLCLDIPVYKNGKKIVGHLLWVSTVENVEKSQELDEDIKVRNMNRFGYWSRERDFNLRYPNFR